MVALAAALAIFLSGQPLLVLHTAVTALLVVALGITTTTGDLSPDPDRFFEALIGGCVALVVNALLPSAAVSIRPKSVRKLPRPVADFSSA